MAATQNENPSSASKNETTPKLSKSSFLSNVMSLSCTSEFLLQGYLKIMFTLDFNVSM
jgi:hypothetical protein